MSDLKFDFEGQLSLPDVCRSLNNNGPNMVGKCINELLSDTTPKDFKEIYKWIDFHICELLQDGLSDFDNQRTNPK